MPNYNPRGNRFPGFPSVSCQYRNHVKKKKKKEKDITKLKIDVTGSGVYC